MEKTELELRDGIHETLKAWHKPSLNPNPFSKFIIFQQARQKTDTNREAIQKTILDALKVLEANHGNDAGLLRKYFIQNETAQNIAQTFHISEASVYRNKDEDLDHLALIIQSMEANAREGWQLELEKRLDLPPSVPLIGAEDYLSRLIEALTKPKAPWIICIDGLGGIGKTSLANALIRQPITATHFHYIAWVNAKQQTFVPGVGLEQIPDSAINAETLVDTLLKQLDSTISLSQPSPQKKAALTEILKKKPCLIVIDNLETMLDYQTLLPLLLKLAKPSKFLLTSRHSLRTRSDVCSLTVNELSQVNTIRFIHQEADIRGQAELSKAPKSQLKFIHEVVGGNPLALKLVIGQISVLSLPQVLENLKQAQGKKIEDLYTYIYWADWELLDEASRKIFLMMPVVQNGTSQQLLTACQLNNKELDQGLQQLAELSLIQVGGHLKKRRYSIHRLTETFIMNEAVRWNTLT